jgi:hypothetical protein
MGATTCVPLIPGALPAGLSVDPNPLALIGAAACVVCRVKLSSLAVTHPPVPATVEEDDDLTSEQRAAVAPPTASSRPTQRDARVRREDGSRRWPHEPDAVDGCAASL